jgi:hypothetical protein
MCVCVTNQASLSKADHATLNQLYADALNE